MPYIICQICYIDKTFIIKSNMENVHGFRDINNRPGGQQGYQNIGLPSRRLQSIPFFNSNRDDVPPLQESIPHTLKVFCCPDIKMCSISVILLILLWVIYIVCLTQGIDYDDSVLQVNQDVMIKAGAVVRQNIKQDFQIYRLISASFLHWNLLHIVLNTFNILFFLSRLQALYRFYYILALLLSSGFAGNLTTAAVNKNIISAGASTMLFGVLGAFVGYLIINWTYLGGNKMIRSQLCCLIGFMVVISFLFSFGKHIDYLAHFSGFVGGILTFIGLFPAINQKSKTFTIIGLGGLFVYDLAFILVLILT